MIIGFMQALIVCAQTDIALYGDTVYSAGDVALYSDFAGHGSAQWTVDGTLTVAGQADIENATTGSLFGGSGSLLFVSSFPQKITGNPTAVPSFQLNNTAGLTLETDLYVNNYATLNSGSVTTGAQTLFIENTAEDALVADMSLYSTEYVIGNLNRKMTANAFYEFPVGDITGIYPVEFVNANAQPEALISFSSEQDEVFACDPNLYSFGYAFNTIEPIGLWSISVTGSDVFGAILYYPQDDFYDDTNQFGVLSRPLLGQCNDWQFAQKTDLSKLPESNVGPGLAMVEASSSAEYVIASASLNDLTIANVIKLDGQSETRFVIPEAYKHQESSLQIFSRWGTKLFDGENYRNTFDFKELQAGTYFYTYRYSSGGSSHEVKSFVEVVKK